MSYKSKFHGREIDAQIQYVKESLPTIIENIAKNIESLSKDKAESSSVPSKTSQIENDSGYITGKTLEEALSTTVKDVVNALRTEHVEHLWGSDIDTKYKVGEYIPSLMIYESGYEIDEKGQATVLYKNAPFDWDGFILTHSCLYDNGDGTTFPFTYQFAISSNGKFVYRIVCDEEFADVPWSDNLVVGEKTDGDGEIFNDYDNNKAISKYSSAKNKNNLSGAMAFTILGVDETAKTYTLDSVEGLEVGDVYTMHTHYENDGGLETSTSRQRMNYGTITAIDTTTNTVTVDNIYVLAQEYLDAGYVFAPLSEKYWYTDGLDTERNTFRIIAKPMVGTRKIGYATSTSGYNNEAHSKGASSHGGRNNISYGSYSDTSGSGNKAGYAGFATNLNNEANGEAAFAANSKNKVNADNGTSFGIGNIINASQGFGTGKINTIESNGINSIVGGTENKITKPNSISVGRDNVISGTNSGSVGSGNQVSQSGTFTAGVNNVANVSNSIISGRDNIISGDPLNSSIIGGGTENNVTNSTQLMFGGQGHTIVSAHHSLTVGKGNINKSPQGTVLGYQNEGGDGAGVFVTNIKNKALAAATSAFGYKTIAESVYQMARGKYNIPDTETKYADIVGGGRSDTDRKNIHTLDWDGTGWFAGGLKIGGTSQDEGSDVATNEEVKNAIATTKSEIKTEANQMYANALKGYASGTFISLDDVSPVPHIVKVNVDISNTTVKVCGNNICDNALLKGSQYNSFDESSGMWTVCNDSGGYYRSFFTGESGVSSNRTVEKLVKVPSNTKITCKLYDVINNTEVSSFITIAFYNVDGTPISGSNVYWYDTSETFTITTPNVDCYLDIRRAPQKGTIQFSGINIVVGEEVGKYEPFIDGGLYTPNDDGCVEINSISPSMTIFTDTPNTIINAEYNRDINKAFEQLQNVILSLGGNV